jgi:hypothetical protein
MAPAQIKKTPVHKIPREGASASPWIGRGRLEGFRIRIYRMKRSEDLYPAVFRSSWSWFSLLYIVFKLIPNSAAAAGLLPACL